MTFVSANIGHGKPTARRVAGQGVLLFAGFGTAQALSFARNAVIGHALSKGDFGIAATITLVLQTIETLSDLGSDRLIVQAADGADQRFISTAHTMLAARGVLLALIVYCAGPWLARMFGAADAAEAFQVAALVPFIKGFLHLDMRLAQRRMDNRPQMLVEVVPQALALLLTWPVLSVTHDYAAVVLLAIGQAFASVALSHMLATTRYRFAADRDIVKRQLAFGWPLLVSALPLVAVYQGDRAIIGSFAGMEALASYTAAGMITMVPGLIAAKVGHAILLPMFADARSAGRPLLSDFRTATEATVVLAAVYLTGFIAAGGVILPIVFGPHYAGLSAVTSLLAAMWALRMVQSVPGMALMALGITTPFAVAGTLRALALPVVFLAARNGADLVTIAGIGCAFEMLSLVYVAARLERVETGLGRVLALRTLFLLPAALVAAVATAAAPQAYTAIIAIAVAAMLAVVGAGASLMPSLNRLLRRALQSRTVGASA